jgi:hypothetical protein
LAPPNCTVQNKGSSFEVAKKPISTALGKAALKLVTWRMDGIFATLETIQAYSNLTGPGFANCLLLKPNNIDDHIRTVTAYSLACQLGFQLE